MSRYYECDLCGGKSAFKPAYTIKIKHNNGTDEVDIYHLCASCHDKIMNKMKEVNDDKS